jgi:uncharacterized membrane protein YcaP (DUF421 family)
MATIVLTAVAYLCLLAAFRIMGRRAVSMMTPLEFVLLVMSGGMVTQAIMRDERSLTNAVLALLTLGATHVLVATLKQRSERFAWLVEGTPVVIYCEGEFLRGRMDRLRFQRDDVLAAARASGLESIEQVKYAIVERDGKISIVKKDVG